VARKRATPQFFMFEYSYAELSAQVDSLPLAFRLWFQWLFLVIVLAPFLLLRHRQGRITALLSVIFILVQFPLAFAVGITHLLSLPHLLIWGPLFGYLAWELRHRRIRPRSILGVWSIIALATLVVTLVFDLRNFGWWLAGQRGILDPGPSPGVPWVSAAMMVVLVGVTAWYVRIPEGVRPATRQD
jgi:hypothetical protein